MIIIHYSSLWRIKSDINQNKNEKMKFKTVLYGSGGGDGGRGGDGVE